MIRIAFPEASSIGIGGYQFSTFDIIEHLGERSGEVSIYYVAHTATPAYRAAADRGLPATLVSPGQHGFRGWRRPWWVLLYLWRAWRFLRRERIDLVQASNETLLFWLLPCLAAGAVPIWNVRAEVLGGWRGWLRQKVHMLVCRHVIFVSEATRRSADRHGMPRGTRTALIRNFVPRRLAAVEPAARDSKREKIVVGFVGRVDDENKRADLALQIARRVLELSDRPVEFAFWGRLNESARRRMQRRIPEHLADRIRLHGPAEDMTGVYQQIDVLLMTSRSEGSPRVIMEAGVHGIPAVSTAAGGTPELIVHGETGFLFQTAEEAAAHLGALTEDGTMRTQMGARARVRFLQQFGHAAAVEQYLDFYRASLGIQRSIGQEATVEFDSGRKTLATTSHSALRQREPDARVPAVR